MAFQSFVDYEEGKPLKSLLLSLEQVIHFQSSPPPDGMFRIFRKLLPGEIEGSSCDDVTFNFQFQEPLPGKITCTNFCLFFQPFVISPKFSRVPRRFSFFDEQFTIPLCSIETIYYTVLQTEMMPTPKELKELTAPLSSMEPVSYIKLFLKDFRVANIDLTRTQYAPNLANQLLCFSKPAVVEHIVQSGANLNWMTRLEFNDEESWRQELRRFSAGPDWRIVNLRRELSHQIPSYPMYVPVPNSISAHDLEQMAEHFGGGRFPVWIWTAPNGTVLIRSSSHDGNWQVVDIVKKYIKCMTNNTQTKAHHLVEIGDGHSIPAVRTAYKKLRKLCSIDSHELYNQREKDWFTRLHDTGWNQLVYYCLRSTAEVLSWMIDRGNSVTVTESEGMDVSAVISSLVQLCANKECRTFTGLERLINKEWIALGHPFGQRVCGVGKSPACPTFLLFLDCIAQLRRLYPIQFGFSDHLLISLWDVSLTGCVPAFACSSVVEQLAADRKGGPFPLARFFTEDYRRLFSNSLNDAAQVLQTSSKSPMRSRIGLQPETTVTLLADLIRPPTLPVDIELWDLCYLRWIPRANPLYGGDMTAEMNLDEIMGSIAQKAGLFWQKQDTPKNVPRSSIGPSYPYSLPQSKPYIRYNLTDQIESLSINSTVTFNQNLKEKVRSNSIPLSIQEPSPAPRRPFRKAPPPPPPKTKTSDSVYRTHF